MARRSLARNGGAFARLIEFSAFEDVYWVACFLLYGPVGILLLWGVLIHAFRQGSALVQRGGLEAEVGAITCGLVFIAFPGNFLERALEMRTFAFYLWLMIGLVFVARLYGFSRETRDLGLSALFYVPVRRSAVGAA